MTGTRAAIFLGGSGRSSLDGVTGRDFYVASYGMGRPRDLD